MFGAWLKSRFKNAHFRSKVLKINLQMTSAKHKIDLFYKILHAKKLKAKN